MKNRDISDFYNRGAALYRIDIYVGFERANRDEYVISTFCDLCRKSIELDRDETMENLVEQVVYEPKTIECELCKQSIEDIRKSQRREDWKEEEENEKDQ